MINIQSKCFYIVYSLSNRRNPTQEQPQLDDYVSTTNWRLSFTMHNQCYYNESWPDHMAVIIFFTFDR